MRAVPEPRLWSSRDIVRACRAPVAAKGCPKLIDPPWMLSFSSGTSPKARSLPSRSRAKSLDLKASRLDNTWALKASWMSTKSTWSRVSSARSNAMGHANEGPMSSCQPGSIAAKPQERRKASGS